MELTFHSIEEMQEFVKRLKGTRGGKGDKEDGEAASGNVPPPMQPPAGGQTMAFNPAGFAPQGPGAGQAGGGFPAAVATGPAPEVLALVQRIVPKIDGAIASGQPADSVLNWFRAECVKSGVAEAAQANMDQIKRSYLPRMPLPALENIAKLMNA